MRIVRVTEPSDLEALFRFRHEIYVEQLGWLPPTPAGLIRDEFDDLAFNYAAFDDGGFIVGSMRVVPDSPFGLPLEHCSPLNGYRCGKQLVELCRLAVHPDCPNRRLGGLLMKAGFQRADLYGATHVVLDTYVGDATAPLYDKMGFERVTDEYGDPSYTCDLNVVTMSQPVQSVYEEWPTARPGLYRFFTSRDDCIHHD